MPCRLSRPDDSGLRLRQRLQNAKIAQTKGMGQPEGRSARVGVKRGMGAVQPDVSGEKQRQSGKNSCRKRWENAASWKEDGGRE